MTLRACLLRRLVLSALLLAGTLAAFGLSYRLYFIGGQSYEFCHYAEAASNILKGLGFSSGSYWPCELAYLEKAGAKIGRTGPLVGRFPLPAYWAAFWMRLAGADDFGMALANGAAHALWVAAVYLSGAWLFSEAAGLAAALLWALDPVPLAGFDLLGYPDMLFGALFCLLNVLFWPRLRRGGPKEPPVFLGLGALAGLAYLARQSFGIWLPFYLAAPLLIGGRSRWKETLAFCAGLFALVLPSAVYYLRHLGAMSPPLFLWNLADGTLVPSLPWMEYRAYAPSDFLHLSVGLSLVAKSWAFLNQFLKEFPSYWQQAAAFPFAALGLLSAEGEASGLALWLTMLLGWEAFVFSFLRYESLGFVNGRYYLWAAPFLLLYAADFFVKRWKDARWRWGAGLALVLLLQGWARGYRHLPRQSDYPGGLAVSAWPEFDYIRRAVPEDAWVLSNIPTQISWYAGRRTINIPNRPEDVERLEARWPAPYLYLSVHRIGELYNYPAWQALLENGGPEALERLGFRIEKSFPGGALFKRIREG